MELLSRREIRVTLKELYHQVALLRVRTHPECITIRGELEKALYYLQSALDRAKE